LPLHFFAHFHAIIAIIAFFQITPYYATLLSPLLDIFDAFAFIFAFIIFHIRYYILDITLPLFDAAISPPLIIITAYLLPLIISFHACRHYAIISPRHARYARLQVDTIELILFSHYFRLTLYFHYYAIFIFSHFSPFSLIIFAHFH
jgi:hypothetical protein